MSDVNQTPAEPNPQTTTETTPKKKGFSLKSLFVLLPLLAILAYWYSIPTLTAKKYAAALTSGDLETAKSLNLPGSFKIPNDDTDPETTTFAPTLVSPSFSDIVYGTRKINVSIITKVDDREVTSGAMCEANRNGVRVESMGP